MISSNIDKTMCVIYQIKEHKKLSHLTSGNTWLKIGIPTVKYRDFSVKVDPDFGKSYVN